jgi:uncharacterized membrane protein HdeD (DUF308 family)
MTATTPRPEDAPDPVAALESRRRRAGWAMAVRGIIAVIFGLIAVRYPGSAAGAFVIIFAVFAFADAILEFVTASAMGRLGLRWGWYVVGALASIAAGILAIAYPRATFLVLVLLVGARAIAIGIVEMAAAFSWRELDGRWLLGLTGALSIILGILLFVSPAQGGLALLWTIGVYAIVFGVMLFVLGVRVVGSGHHGSTSHPAAAS